jgi:hypothetical protein
MSSTITGTVTHSVKLGSGTYSSPLTIAAAATVSYTGAAATVYSANVATIVDLGTISSTLGDGIQLASGGSVDNTGVVLAANHGVIVNSGSGTVTNSGNIIAAGDGGVGLFDGGDVVNYAGATISGAGAGGAGVFITGASGTVTNYGSIAGNNNIGVLLSDGGTVANQGSISGSNTGVFIKNALGTVTNDGVIMTVGSNGAGVYIQNGGQLTNAASGTITGSQFGAFLEGGFSTTENSGTILGTYDGLVLGLGGIVTNAAGGSVSGASTGVYIKYRAAGTVINLGDINATGTGGAGIELADGGTVTNDPSGSISGGGFGVFVLKAPGTVINEGAVSGSHGIALEDGGSVTNVASGTVSGGVAGVFATGVGAVLDNYGSIVATLASGAGADIEGGGDVVNNAGASLSGGGFGIYLTGGTGTVTNAGTVGATGASGFGVDLKDGGTIIDSGLIEGSNEAVYLGGSGDNLLKLEAGYSLSGAVFGNSSASNTLELSGSLGPVTVRYNDLDLFNFGFVRFGAPEGYDETLVITNTNALPGTIEGFNRTHEIIDLRQLNDPSAAVFNFDSVTDKLTITEGAQSVTLQLAGDLSGVVWQARTDLHNGTDIEPACYLAGTRILTREGEVAVEKLAIGDRIMTISGEAKRIKWIGKRAYDPRFVAGSRGILPIRIRCGALGDELPRRDLSVSPEHALFIDGMLVPAKALVNGVSIVQERLRGTIEYYHIELAEHDVIYAEGVAAETYVDCGNRGMFQNASEFRLLDRGESKSQWTYCAPLVTSGPELQEVRLRIAERARAPAAVSSDAAAEADLWRSGAPAAAEPAPAGNIAPKIVKLAAA